jgi:Ca-activated chloride channel family protein
VTFAHPERLWLFAILPMLAAWMTWGRRRRLRDWAALGQPGQPVGDGGRSWLAAIICLLMALAQPRWGRSAGPPLPPGHDVLLVVDVSRSMGAEDAVPNRLRVAVEAAESLVKALGREPGTRVGLVAFAGRGVVRAPLTENLGAVVEALDRLRPGDVRPGGTSLGDALDVALNAFDGHEHAAGRVIVLFSDGEDHAGSWPALLDRLDRARVIVHSVAVGDPEQGHKVPSGRGSSEPLKYQGKTVLSRRTDLPFESLARATGGAVVRLGLASADLGSLYQSRIEPVARQARAGSRTPERGERYDLFVLAALILGVVGSWPRRGLGLVRIGWAVAAIFAMLGAGSGSEPVRDAIARGRGAYQAGRLAEALEAFDRANALNPDDSIARYDAAATLYRLERYPEALARYTEARLRADSRLRTKIDYALGNTALALGEVAEAIRHYDACLASTAPGADLDAVRRDAAVNRRFAAESPRAPSIPPERQPDSRRRTDRPRPPEPDSGRSETSKPSPPNPEAKEQEEPPNPSGRSSSGGHGGDATGSRPRSPEDRLNEALDQIREARRRRLDDEPPRAELADDRKDW